MNRRVGHTFLILALPQAGLLPLVLIARGLLPGDGYRVAWGLVAGIVYVITAIAALIQWTDHWMEELREERLERERRERQRRLDEQIGIPRPPR